MAGKPKPLISANMVTSVRLLAMPLIAWLIYQNPVAGGSSTGLWGALVLGTVVGCTDFVDGALARKYGPTVLGGLMDPLADKVFVALIYLPLMHLGFFPKWAVGLLFVREFLVTSIRSAYEWRGLQLKTSFFGKVKTWVQMQGIVVLVLVALVSRDTFLTILWVGAALPLLPLAFFWFAKKEFSLSFALGTVFMLGTVALFAIPESPATSVDIAVYLICLVTWMSGLDYLLGAIPALHKAGGFHRADVVRVIGAIAIPISAVVALMDSAAPAIPVLGVVAFELAVGGLDNLLARHKANASTLAYGARALGSAGLLLLTLVLKEQAAILAWAAMAISLIGSTSEFWRGRSHYLDDTKWDEKLVET